MDPDLAFLAMKAPQRAATDVDLYILAGQSNGDGTSGFASAKPGTRDAGRYENVRYCARDRATDGRYRFYFERFEPVHEGLGSSTELIGPELGMARVLDPLYDAPDRKAVIVKVGAGGTSLLMHEPLHPRYTDEKSIKRFRARGSWYPSAEEGDYWQPSGFLLRELKDYASHVYRFLQGMEFRSVTFRAICWMQGETDRHYPDEYAAVFPVFCRSIREHLTALTGADQSRLPIVAGEISETFGNLDEASVAQNRAFIAMQRGLQATIPALTAIPTSGFKLNVPGEHGESIPVGQDAFHWNYTDMLAIGELFGKAAYEQSHKA